MSEFTKKSYNPLSYPLDNLVSLLLMAIKLVRVWPPQILFTTSVLKKACKNKWIKLAGCTQNSLPLKWEENTGKNMKIHETSGIASNQAQIIGIYP